MRIVWRHPVETPRGAVWVRIHTDETIVTVTVVGDHGRQTTCSPRGPFEHTDYSRIIPADLGDRRIVLDELRHIIGDALHGSKFTDEGFRAIMRNIHENYPR